MSEHANELSQRFAKANAGLIAFVTGCSDEQLALICPGVDQTVVALAYHLASHYPHQLHWLRRVASGKPVTTEWEEIHTVNARQFVEHPAPSRTETLALLAANGNEMTAAISALTDEQMEASATVAPAENRVLTAEQVVRWLIVHHIKDHMKSMRAAIGE